MRSRYGREQGAILAAMVGIQCSAKPSAVQQGIRDGGLPWRITLIEGVARELQGGS